MHNTMNNRLDIPCYSFIAINPGKVTAFFRCMVSFFKAAFAVRKTNEHERLYHKTPEKVHSLHYFRLNLNSQNHLHNQHDHTPAHRE